MRAISNRLLLSAASIPPAVPSGISSFFFLLRVCLCVCGRMCWCFDREMSWRETASTTATMTTTAAASAAAGVLLVLLLLLLLLLLPSLLLLVLRDATGMMGRVAATTRSIPEECRRLRRMRERGGSRHSCDNEREHHRREKFLSWLR